MYNMRYKRCSSPQFFKTFLFLFYFFPQCFHSFPPHPPTFLGLFSLNSHTHAFHSNALQLLYFLFSYFLLPISFISLSSYIVIFLYFVKGRGIQWEQITSPRISYRCSIQVKNLFYTKSPIIVSLSVLP
jgi:hypothetical protein